MDSRSVFHSAKQWIGKDSHLIMRSQPYVNSNEGADNLIIRIQNTTKIFSVEYVKYYMILIIKEVFDS